MLILLEKILLFLIILFLPTQLGLHFWPEFSYIYSLKIDYLSPTLYFWDILVAGLLIVWTMQKPRINKTALNLFLFFLFTQALSLVSALNIGAGFVRIEQYVITGFFGIFLASYSSGDLVKKISSPLALGVIIEAGISVLEFIKGEAVGLWILGERTFTISTPGIAKFDFYGHEFLRPYATFPHPNVLAGFMLISICILYNYRNLLLGSYEKKQECFLSSLKSLFKKSTSFQLNDFLKDHYFSFKGKQVLIELAILSAGISIFLSMSRTAILAGFIVVFYLSKKLGRTILAITATILLPVLFTRYSSILNFDNLALLRREELADSAWRIFLKSPLYGVGLNNYIPVQASDLIVGPSRFLQPVHNIFLLILAETGLIGLIGFTFLIGFILLKLFRLSMKFSKGAAGCVYFLTYVLLPWLIILFLGMFDHYFLTLPQGYRLLFLVWGLSFFMIRYFGEQHFQNNF
ncbi:O-antigen ligase family protein [Patescibacteria group bacterium]|nr:O-antigen ligase family protein [Patescibacteria group bacterium]